MKEQGMEREKERQERELEERERDERERLAAVEKMKEGIGEFSWFFFFSV